MEVLSLEQTTLINLGVTFWRRESEKDRLEKHINGLVLMDKALENLKKSAFDLPLSTNLKKRLLEIIERIGYELYIFITRTPIDVFQSGFNIANDLAWSPFGTVNENSTYRKYISRNPDQRIVIFKCACLTCCEDVVKSVWKALSEDEKEQLSKPPPNLLTLFWLYYMEDKLNDFISTYGTFILGFDPFRSVEYNMTVYSVNSNSKLALSYFLNRVPEPELRLLTGENSTTMATPQVLLTNLLKTSKQEHLRYICSFLERPTADSSDYDLIVNAMPDHEAEEFVNHVLRQVNLFGDLHYNIFRRIVKAAGVNLKKTLMLKLDFYVLSLLSKGRFENFENILTKNAKQILVRQICYRLRNSKGLAPFFTILRNNQQHLLVQCFRYLSSTEEDEKFFRTHLDSILSGSQYDSVSC